MNEIKKEDWNFISNLNDKDFEKNFNNLIQKYYENEMAELEKMDKKDKINRKKDLESARRFCVSDRWVAELPTKTKIIKNKDDYVNFMVEKEQFFVKILIIMRNV